MSRRSENAPRVKGLGGRWLAVAIVFGVCAIAGRAEDDGAAKVVTLNGQVTNPVLRSDANNVVKRIEGVERVDNQIQVLPVSFFDDGLRVQLFRSIYGYPTLQKYVLGVQKPIRIIVQNGHVTLMGVVDSEMDRNIAGIRANGVPGVFSVDNQLQVVKG